MKHIKLRFKMKCEVSLAIELPLPFLRHVVFKKRIKKEFGPISPDAYLGQTLTLQNSGKDEIFFSLLISAISTHFDMSRYLPTTLKSFEIHVPEVRPFGSYIYIFHGN